MATKKRTVTDKITYSNRKKQNSDFSKKDLKRSNCFSTDFTGSNFSLSSFKGAQFKNCNFTDCNFDSSEFVATNLRNSRFINAQLKNVIFDAANFDGVNFENATFENVIIANTDTSKALNLDTSAAGIKLFDSTQGLEISERLERAVRASKKNEFIKKAGVLDTKDGKMNLVTMMILLESFNEEILITSLSKLKADIEENFFTVTYLVDAIKAYQAEDAM